MDFLKENKISRSSVDDTIRNLLEFMNSISINLKEKGSINAGSRELRAGSRTPQIKILPPNCACGPDLSLTERVLPMRR